MNWTQEQRDEMIRLWDGGKRSYSEIARILGLNKNQIVGRMRREKRIRGIPVLDQYAHFRTTKPRKKKVKKMMTLPTRAEFVMSKRVVPVVVPDHGQLSSIVDVTGCRWPVSFDDAVPGGHLFCNHATDGQTYCPYHSQESVAHYSRALIRKTTRDALFAYTRESGMSRAEKYILTLQDASAFGHPMETIIEAVSRVMRVGRRDMVSPHRAQHLVDARHIFYWFARMYTARSYPEIGRFINRDHCTIMHGVRKVEANKLELWPKLKAVAQELGVDLYERQAA